MIAPTVDIGAADRAPTDRPNIVIINCDNLGYGDLGCYGNAMHRTPRIDGMAAEGMRFTDCYAASPVCTSARAALAFKPQGPSGPPYATIHAQPQGRSA